MTPVINLVSRHDHDFLFGLMQLRSSVSFLVFLLGTTENLTDISKFGPHSKPKSSLTSSRWQNPWLTASWLVIMRMDATETKEIWIPINQFTVLLCFLFPFSIMDWKRNNYPLHKVVYFKIVVQKGQCLRTFLLRLTFFFDVHRWNQTKNIYIKEKKKQKQKKKQQELLLFVFLLLFYLFNHYVWYLFQHACTDASSLNSRTTRTKRNSLPS